MKRNHDPHRVSQLEEVHAFISNAKRMGIIDLREHMLDKGRLCPGCMLPVTERGRPGRWFGEIFCGRCLSVFHSGKVEN